MSKNVKKHSALLCRIRPGQELGVSLTPHIKSLAPRNSLPLNSYSFTFESACHSTPVHLPRPRRKSSLKDPKSKSPKKRVRFSSESHYTEKTPVNQMLKRLRKEDVRVFRPAHSQDAPMVISYLRDVLDVYDTYTLPTHTRSPYSLPKVMIGTADLAKYFYSKVISG